jgi:hypothetical protein
MMELLARTQPRTVFCQDTTPARHMHRCAFRLGNTSCRALVYGVRRKRQANNRRSTRCRTADEEPAAAGKRDEVAHTRMSAVLATLAVVRLPRGTQKEKDCPHHQPKHSAKLASRHVSRQWPGAVNVPRPERPPPLVPRGPGRMGGAALVTRQARWSPLPAPLLRAQPSASYADPTIFLSQRITFSPAAARRRPFLAAPRFVSLSVFFVLRVPKAVR